MNEELRYESEKLNLNMHKVQSEKAQTQELRKEDYQILEATQLRVDKQTKVINKICRDIAKVKHLVSTIAKEFNVSYSMFAGHTDANNTDPSNDDQSSNKTNTIPKARNPLDE